MHDIDRTQRELELAMHEYQPEYQTEYQEYAHEAMGETDEFETFANELWQEAEAYESGLNEAEEMELAAEFLEVTNEQELDHFLSKVIQHAGKGVKGGVPSPLRKSLGRFLKPIAKAALPLAGKIAGGFFGGPLGGAIGQRLGSAAGRLFGLELEGLSAEDREFHVARRFLQFASRGVQNAMRSQPGGNPNATAKRAIVGAVRRFAPGFRPASGRPPVVRQNFGNTNFNFGDSSQGGDSYNDPYGGASPDGGNPYGNPYGAQDGGDGDPYGGGTPDGDYSQMGEVPAQSQKQGRWIRKNNRIILLGV